MFGSIRRGAAGLLLGLLATPVPIAAQPHDSAGERAALQAQAEAWDRAIVAKDANAIAANLHPEFQQIASDGSRLDRAGFLDSLLSPRLQIDPYTVEDFEIMIDGDTAFLRGRTHMTGRYDGKPFSSDYRYLDVYLRRDGVWRVRHVQTTPVQPE